MTSPDVRREEWVALVAERAAARAELVRALERAGARARDPLRLKETIRRHPLLVAGIATGAGALLVRMLVPSKSPREAKEPAQPPADTHDGPSLIDSLRDMAIRAAMPWLARMAEEFLSAAPDEPSPGGNGSAAANRASPDARSAGSRS